MRWKTIKLNQAAIRIGGGTPSRDEKSYWGANLPWFTVADLANIDDIQNLQTSRECITKEGLENSSAKIIPKGAVVFSSRVVVGKVGIACNDIATNQDFCSFVPIDGINQEFLAYYLIKTKHELRSHQRGATIRGVSTKFLDSIDVPLPSLDVQLRMVARIKECMDRVEEIEQLRNDSLRERDCLLESLIEAEFQQIEGCRIQLGQVCSITSSLVDPRKQDYQNLLHVGGANIESKTGRLIDLRTAREEKLVSGKFYFEEGVVLYNKIRPYLMKVARPEFKGLCSADMYPLVPTSTCLSKNYLFYLLLSRDFTEHAIAGSNRAGMPKVNRDHLFSFEFTLPPLQYQERISQELDKALSVVEKLKSNVKDAAQESTALRQSILRKAFAGEL